MNKITKSLGYVLCASLFACSAEQTNDTTTTPATTVINPQKSKKKIKLAILLDTSNSMDGLIDQAKNQLWKIVTKLAKAKDQEGGDPEIELALYQYGNDDLSMMKGYVQQMSPFTTELDEISEKLFALSTNGGSEFCGEVINSSLEDLEWSNNPEDLQFIFIAGNEEFNQGDPKYYKKVCKLAKEKNIVVNTIFCGNPREGINTFWKDGADIAQGKYLNIDQDAQTIHIVSPYDDEIAQLNIQLNNTYIYYGKNGYEKKQKQIKEDENAASMSDAVATSRYESKISKAYKNTKWDLVDASEEKGFDVQKIKHEELPEEVKKLNKEDQIKYIEGKKTERNTIKNKMQGLNKKREEYVNKKMVEQSLDPSNQLDHAIISAIVDQAKRKSFQFDN